MFSRRSVGKKDTIGLIVFDSGVTQENKAFPSDFWRGDIL